nr:piggyBac transposable element-derived protein 4-like [Onthophagus taurus]
MAATPKEAFQLFVTPVIIQEIVNCTNLEGKRVYGAKGKPWKDVTVDEFLHSVVYLFMRKLTEAGMFLRENYFVMNLPILYTEPQCPDLTTREPPNARLGTNKLAMVSYIWDLFIQQCKTCVIPDTNVTIDEQLVGFRGRFTFVQYMPSKPAKYGLKIFWMCESTSGYILDGLVYVGRQPGEPPHKNLGLEVVQTLVRGIHNSGRNLTIDNFFTSVPLATYLLDKNITVVGTLRQNKRDIPREMKASKDRVVQNNVCMGSVNIMDQMVSTYTCKRQSKRWPNTFFFNIIDVAALPKLQHRSDSQTQNVFERFSEGISDTTYAEKIY